MSSGRAQAAKRALPAFAASGNAERIALLERIIAVYLHRENKLMAAMTEEMSAPRALKAHTGAGLAALRQAVEALRSHGFETREGVSIIRREAIGVAGLITPWNRSNPLICNKLSSAFAAGCPVVLKPLDFTPVSALVLAGILLRGGGSEGPVQPGERRRPRRRRRHRRA